MTEGWTGDNIGDFLIGVKYNLLSEADQKTVAAAVRASLKLPTGDDDSGVSTGQLDANFDFVVSKEARERVEVAGYGGFAFRGSPDGSNKPNAFRWGIGAGFPSRSALRVTTELHGEMPFDDAVNLTSPIVGDRPQRRAFAVGAPQLHGGHGRADLAAQRTASSSAAA